MCQGKNFPICLSNSFQFIVESPKWTDVISRDFSFLEWRVQFTMVPLEVLSSFSRYNIIFLVVVYLFSDLLISVAETMEELLELNTFQTKNYWSD